MKVTNPLLDALQDAYFRESFRKRADYTERQMKNFIKRNRVDELAQALLSAAGPDGRYSICDVVPVARDYLTVLQDEPEEGWPLYCYNYYLSKLFPDKVQPHDESAFAEGRQFLMQTMRALYEYEERTLPFDPKRTFRFLTKEQILEHGYSTDYLRMLDMIEQYYVYEFMRIGVDVTPWDTLGHVSGVHYVAMFLAEQLAQVGVPVDLGIVSGAAAVHDIGKYGCKENEQKRVPYLHYYYTDWCCRENGLLAIGHIAANHSVWDLELENLSVESLLLIYADFRVKANGPEQVHFFSLKDSYDVILSKLDNVDEAKKLRYQKVYAKLSDFEEYVKSLGVTVDLPLDHPEVRPTVQRPVQKETVLLEDTDVVRRYKFTAFDHNIRLMSQFLQDSDFSTLIEAGRSERDWKDIRTYITILNEYSTYMTERQKRMTLKFLYEQLLNREGDIRIEAAELMGQLVAHFNIKYSKWLPEGAELPPKEVSNHMLFEEYLESFIHPDPRYSEQFRRWINWRLSDFVHPVLKTSEPEDRAGFFDLLEPYFKKYDYEEELTIDLLKTLNGISPDLMTESFQKTARKFLKKTAASESLPVRIATLFYGELLVPEQTEDERIDQLLDLLDLPKDPEFFEAEESALFLEDLKLGTHWIIKVANIRLMLHFLKNRPDVGARMHLAMHLANLLKVSSYISVLKAAGDGLLTIAQDMDPSQRNELVVEQVTSLQIGNPVLSKYAPEYLGRLILMLAPKEFDEAVNTLQSDVLNVDAGVASSMISTLGAILERFDTMGTREEDEARIRQILFIIIKAYAHYKKELSRDAFGVLGRYLFASPTMPLWKKDYLFAHCFKKLLVMLEESTEEELDFYSNAAVLNDIYRYISQHELEEGEFHFPDARKVCFYPGTFDPFSMGHKAVARQIRDLGFAVYLALDEFSWSKHTQPRLLRRAILNMSIADEEGLYPFPDDIPINIANPADVHTLKELFADRELYVAVGTDVIENASAYRLPPGEDTIHSLNHIAFERATRDQTASGKKVDNRGITGEVLRLKLDKFYEDISSTQIRDNVDHNRDISSLTDPIAANYIYDKDLYLREPTYKHVLEAQDLTFGPLAPQGARRLQFLTSRMADSSYDTQRFGNYLAEPGVEVLHIEHASPVREVIACAAVRKVETTELRAECQSSEVAAHIRQVAGGNIASIGFFYADEDCGVPNLGQILLTELASALIERGYTYAIYSPVDPTGYEPDTLKILTTQGFIRLTPNAANHPVYAVEMKMPNVVFRDVENVIKSPFNKDPRVQAAIDASHNDLLAVLRSIYPGQLILSYSMSAFHHKIIDRVTSLNDVSTVEDKSHPRGPYMSVPFGKVLGDVLVPNTVTKQLNIEKYFNRMVKGFTIDATRNYSPVMTQMKTIKSFDRPVILIDDLLHKSYRLQRLWPVLQEAGVELKTLLVGVMTGQARDLMEELGIPAQSLYFLPALNVWLNERDCYPLIGGDSIENPAGVGKWERNASVNLILPYIKPEFITRGLPPGADKEAAVYRYSLVCLRNSRRILATLQEVYQEAISRKLTIERLGEVITVPRLTEIDVGVHFDENMEPARFIDNNIERLYRLKWGEIDEITDET